MADTAAMEETPGARIERIAAAKGLASGAKLADALGVTYETLRKWREGHTAPKRASQARVSAYLGVEPAVFMHGTEDRSAAPVPTAREPSATYSVEPAGRPRHLQRARVVGTARLGDNGYYECTDHDDGSVESYSPDPEAYALRVRGDSMHPAIRHGSFVVVEPNAAPVIGEYVAIALADGRKMVKELVIERTSEVVVESVNGNRRQTIDRAEIETMHPVAAVVSASKWRPS